MPSLRSRVVLMATLLIFLVSSMGTGLAAPQYPKQKRKSVTNGPKLGPIPPAKAEPVPEAKPVTPTRVVVQQPVWVDPDLIQTPWYEDDQTLAGVITAGSGVVLALAVGVPMAVSGRSDLDDAATETDKAEYDKLVDSGETVSGIGDTAIGLGLAAAVVGGLIIIWPEDGLVEKTSARQPASSQLVVTPWARPDGGGLGVVGRF